MSLTIEAKRHCILSQNDQSNLPINEFLKITDLVIFTLKFLPWSDLENCRVVNRAFYQAIQSDEPLRATLFIERARRAITLIKNDPTRWEYWKYLASIEMLHDILHAEETIKKIGDPDSSWLELFEHQLSIDVQKAVKMMENIKCLYTKAKAWEKLLKVSSDYLQTLKEYTGGIKSERAYFQFLKLILTYEKSEQIVDDAEAWIKHQADNMTALKWVELYEVVKKPEFLANAKSDARKFNDFEAFIKIYKIEPTSETFQEAKDFARKLPDYLIFQAWIQICQIEPKEENLKEAENMMMHLQKSASTNSENWLSLYRIMLNPAYLKNALTYAKSITDLTVKSKIVSKIHQSAKQNMSSAGNGFSQASTSRSNSGSLFNIWKSEKAMTLNEMEAKEYFQVKLAVESWIKDKTETNFRKIFQGIEQLITPEAKARIFLALAAVKHA